MESILEFEYYLIGLFHAEERKQKIAQTSIEIMRLNWSTQQGRDHLQEHYNKRARSQLTDEELLDFLDYLKTQPTPIDGSITEGIMESVPEFESDLIALLDAYDRKQKIAQTTIEIKRLNWSTQQGRNFLQQHYDKRARSELTDWELLDFLYYLKAQPTPIDGFMESVPKFESHLVSGSQEIQTVTAGTPPPVSTRLNAHDRKDYMAQTNRELKRLNWSTQQGRDRLRQLYNKQARSLLTDRELLDFVNYLKAQPNPIDGSITVGIMESVPEFESHLTIVLDEDERKQKIGQTTIEIKRLNWSTQQGRDFLEQQYNKRARSQLSDEELLEFLDYLKAQPTPSSRDRHRAGEQECKGSASVPAPDTGKKTRFITLKKPSFG